MEVVIMTTRHSKNKKGETLEANKSVRGFEAVIDYPQKGETIMPGHYAVRISGTPETDVEVSINGGPWQCCRADAGFYWFDWWAEPGDARLLARFKDADNDWRESKSRQVVVENPGNN
ncbi:MAG: hypothetical protein KCHDKBKB_01640 [Elusimicrobia bacterium]|nr:hypothetical protein [Elusimicrobiota bacterium]